MNMFLNYQNVPDTYIPNNMRQCRRTGKSYTKLEPVNSSKPYEAYDIKGNLIGYFWHQGETVNLEFNIDGEVTVESDAIILTTHGQIPDATQGALYQRAYNIVDLRSWTCTSIVGDNHIWSEDAEFLYDETSTRSVYVSAADYLKDKYIDVTIYNFRHEPVHKFQFTGSPKVVANINTELSSKIKKGIYYCSLTVFNDVVNLPIFTNTDCVLLVK